MIAWLLAQLLTRPRMVAALAGALALAALLWGVHENGRRAGQDAALSTIQRQNEEARHAADHAGDRVSDCYDRGPEWVWSVPRGQCVRGQGNPR